MISIVALLAVFSNGDNPCAKMDCASGVLGFFIAFIVMFIYHAGKSQGK